VLATHPLAGRLVMGAQAARSEIRHATTVAVAGRGLMIEGPSGSGKSALALELMAFGAELVADDRTRVARMLLDVVLTLLSTVGHLAPAEQPRTAQEYVDLILSYLDAKFPSEDDPVWTDPGRRIRPISPAPQVGPDHTD